ncbi:MAG: hypothetical protein QM820_21035 [Minicystis sp.]
MTKMHWIPLAASLIAAAACSSSGGHDTTSSSTTGSGGSGGSSTATGTGGAATSSGSGGSGGAAPTKTVFVVGGQDLRRVISTDGQTWTNDVYVAPNGLDNSFWCISSGKGIIVAGGNDGVWTSPDGIAWNKATSPTAQEHMHACVSVYDGDRFVIVTGGATYRSTDGITWERSQDDATASGHWQGMAFGNGHYVAVGDGHRKVSEDAVTWHDFATDADALHGIVFAQGKFVAVGDKGRHAVSADGVTWTDDVSEGDALGDMQSLAYGNGTFVAMNCCQAITSTDGITWQTQGGGVNGRVVFADGIFVAAGWRTHIGYSTDGKSFQGVFDSDGPNQFDSSQQAPWFTTLGVGKVVP